MHEYLITMVVLIAGVCGVFCVGAWWCIRKVFFWRIEWIKLEHDLARLQNRKPRNIEEFASSKKGDPK